jgi:hypothetical protein
MSTPVVIHWRQRRVRVRQARLPRLSPVFNTQYKLYVRVVPRPVAGQPCNPAEWPAVGAHCVDSGKLVSTGLTMPAQALPATALLLCSLRVCWV